MSNEQYIVEEPANEAYDSFAPGTPERERIKKKLEELKSETIEIPAIIGGEEVKTGRTLDVVMPHNHQHTLAKAHLCGEKEVERAIDAANKAWETWSELPWQDRVAVFNRAAEILTNDTEWRDTMNASTMLGQSKTPQQAEIEAVGELADFLRFNCYYLANIMKEQPHSPDGLWNRLEYRPLEGFVFAVTPFNFTAIGGNLPSAPALCGNVALWKPAPTALYSNYFFMKLLEEAGLPDGVINFLPGEGPDVGDPVLKSADLAGLHFTGSTATFHHLWKEIADNIDHYHTYPRIVGETGGKDFIFAHNTAEVDALVPAALRAAFEYQGQKCSAASRMYVPSSIWDEFRSKFLAEVKKIKYGDVEDFSNFMGAVIDQKSFDKITSYIDFVKESEDAEILYGGSYDDSTGYFIEPTLVLANKPDFKTMREEIFGPVLTIYVYEDDAFEDTLEICNNTSPYGLTGAIFATDQYVLNKMNKILRHAAGNFYINDKPTAAVVNQQPFGGMRKSGTNDKAGSAANLMRWLSMRAIKENQNPPKSWTYPYMQQS